MSKSPSLILAPTAYIRAPHGTSFPALLSSMTSRPAFSGPRRKLVLAFDVGTTYSGISYRYVAVVSGCVDAATILIVHRLHLASLTQGRSQKSKVLRGRRSPAPIAAAERGSPIVDVGSRRTNTSLARPRSQRSSTMIAVATCRPWVRRRCARASTSRLRTGNG